MIDRNLIKELQEQGHNINQIAKQLGVSRQRIHQIVNNYKNTGKQGRRKKFYENMGICVSCKKRKAIILHHIDKDNLNDIEENLEKLCLSCHLHKHGKGLPLPSPLIRFQVLVTQDQKANLELISYYSGMSISKIMRLAIEKIDPKQLKFDEDGGEKNE